MMRSHLFDPAKILGCAPDEVHSLMHGRRMTPGEAEAVARTSYRWRRHLRDRDSYWVVTSQASRILGVPPGHVTRLLDEGQLPYITDPDGVRLIRRQDVEDRARHVRHESHH